MTTAEACTAYLKALDRERRAQAAEDRAFKRFWEEPTQTRAGTNRKAISRVSVANHARICAEEPVWDALGAHPWDDTPAGKAARQADPERFARAILQEDAS